MASMYVKDPIISCLDQSTAKTRGPPVYHNTSMCDFTFPIALVQTDGTAPVHSFNFLWGLYVSSRRHFHSFCIAAWGSWFMLICLHSDPDARNFMFSRILSHAALLGLGIGPKSASSYASSSLTAPTMAALLLPGNICLISSTDNLRCMALCLRERQPFSPAIVPGSTNLRPGAHSSMTHFYSKLRGMVVW